MITERSDEILAELEIEAIDCHAHYWPQPYLDVITGYKGDDPAVTAVRNNLNGPVLKRAPLLVGGLDRRLEVMSGAGIGRQVLSASMNVFVPDESFRVEAVQAFNDGCDEIARAHPNDFSVYCSVPVPFVDAAIAETKRIAERPSTAGMSLCTHTKDVPIDDERFLPLYELWNELGMTVFLHPNGFCVRGLLNDYSMDWDIGAPLDDTIAAVRLINSGFAQRFPNLRWVIPHLGGTLPFLLGRLDQHWDRDKATRELKQMPSLSLDNLYFDTAGHSTPSIKLAVELLGANRVTLGSDFPIVSGDDLGLCVRTLLDAVPDDETRRKVLMENAEGLIVPGLRR